jgi:hypothetical protein
MTTAATMASVPATQMIHSAVLDPDIESPLFLAYLLLRAGPPPWMRDAGHAAG